MLPLGQSSGWPIGARSANLNVAEIDVPAVLAFGIPAAGEGGAWPIEAQPGRRRQAVRAWDAVERSHHRSGWRYASEAQPSNDSLTPRAGSRHEERHNDGFLPSTRHQLG